MVEMSLLKRRLESDGWGFDDLDADLVVLGYQGRNVLIQVFVQTVGTGASIVAVPCVSNLKEECAPNLYRFLLLLNYQFPKARFAIDADGDVALIMDIDSLENDELSDGLRTVCLTVDQLHPTLQRLAFDSSYGNPEIRPEHFHGASRRG